MLQALAEKGTSAAAGDIFSYSLIGTPCATVFNDDETVEFWPHNIQQLFPDDLMLVDMEADSYIGVALKDRTGKTIGLLSMLDDKPMPNYQTTPAFKRIIDTKK